MRRNRLKKHRSTIICGAVVLGSIAFSWDDMTARMEGVNSLKEQAIAQQFNLLALQQQEEILVEQGKIANARMERGCVPVVDANPKLINGYKYFNLVSLMKGQPVLDRTNKNYLPAGTVVCGSNGDTAELVNKNGIPVMENFAVGGSKENVEKNVRKFAGSKSKVFWSTPITGEVN